MADKYYIVIFTQNLKAIPFLNLKSTFFLLKIKAK